MTKKFTGFVLLLFFYCGSFEVAGQLQVTATNSAIQLAQKLVGEGVTISNVTLTRSDFIIPTGIFVNQGGNAIGIDSGIVITSGRAKSDFIANRFGVDGNGTGTASSRLADNNLGLPGDITLANELGIPLSQLNDAIALEFDFVPLGDTIQFNYVMSSEEYTPGTVCIFNDAFGFFISGPGITGSRNIARIPGTNTPVTITNINDIRDAGCINNPRFYVDNTTNTTFLHEGHTTVFTAVSQVQPCETYHLKIVVADRGDHLWDTGVFLQAKSLSSNAIGITNLTQTDPNGSSYLVEGCATGSFVIRRPRKEPNPLTVSLSYGGTAINGVDVQPLPLTVTIPANDSFVVVNVIPIIDGIPEGVEKVVVYALAGCTAGTPTDSTIIEIRDYDILALTPDTAIVCRNGTVQLNASGGYSQYQWNPDPTLNNTSIQNPVATPVNDHTVYICTATEGTCNARDSVLVNLKLLELLAKTDVNCAAAATGTIKVSGGSAWQQPVAFSIDGLNWQPDSVFTGLPAGNYWIKIRDAACVDSINVQINQAFPDISVTNLDITGASCTGGADGVLALTAGGGNGLFQYSSDGSTFQNNNVFTLAAGNYNIIIKDGNGCMFTQNVVIPLTNTVTLNTAPDTSICEGTGIQLAITSNADTYSWSPAATLDNPGIKNPYASPVIPTQYVVTATTGICTRKDSILIGLKPAPVADAGEDISVCYGKVVQLNGSGGTAYEWTPSTYFTTSPDMANPSVKATNTITYFLSVINTDGCRSVLQDAVDINVTPSVKIFAGRDTVAAINQPVQLQVREISNAGITQYIWSPAVFLNDPFIADPVATLPQDQRYIVTGITADGCEGKDDIFIKAYQGPEIYVPSGFTPNNDGLNDILKAIPVGISRFKFFRIYNRWGQLIFSTQEPSTGWDGRVKGVLQPSNSFIWIAEAIDFKGNLISRKGVVTLIR